MNQPASTNPFKGIKNAPPSFGGDYVKPGKHLLEVKEHKLIKSQQKNTDMFVAVFTVLESNNPAHPAGSTCSWIVNFQHASALSNLKSYVMSVYNCLEADVDEDLTASLTDASQPGRGVVVQCEANHVKTRKGGDFTKCAWKFVSAAE